jgi:hypothetical protein
VIAVPAYATLSAGQTPDGLAAGLRGDRCIYREPLTGGLTGQPYRSISRYEPSPCIPRKRA